MKSTFLKPGSSPAIFLLVAVLLLAGRTNQAASNGSLDDSSAKRMKVVVLEGSGYNRGLTHGSTLKKEINEVIKKWKAHLEQAYKMSAEQFVARFLKQTDFVPAIKKWTPDLLEEVKGIADGAGIDFNTMLLFQLPDEEWANAQYIVADHCSGLGFNKRGNRPAMIAQNMDIDGFYDGYQIVLHVKHNGSDLESFVFTCAGLIALNGMNSKSVGVTVNTLSQLSHCKDGLPVAFVIRGLLEQKTQKDAISFLHKIKHASGQNYIIGGPEKVYDFEASSNRVTEYRPSKDSEIVYHTNHPLANNDYNSEFRVWLAKTDESKKKSGNTVDRFQSLEKRLSGSLNKLDVDVIQVTLRSHDSEKNPVCSPYKAESNSFTFGSIIMSLSSKPEILITAGPPDKSEYSTFSFSNKTDVAKK